MVVTCDILFAKPEYIKYEQETEGPLAVGAPLVGTVLLGDRVHHPEMRMPWPQCCPALCRNMNGRHEDGRF